jgi:small nuclear ribonucleoprotein (snRNP)-like protein
MEKQLVSALAVFVFCLLYTLAIAAQTKSESSPASADRTRAEIHKLGFGKRVKVKMQNGLSVRGRITGLSDNQFVITDSETGGTTKIAYGEVAGLTKQRKMPGILRAPFVGIAVTAAVVGTLTVMTLAFLD